MKHESRCAYSDHKRSNAGTVECSGQVATFTAHDATGCKAVCGAHAAWLIRTQPIGPLGQGRSHSPDCSGYPEVK